MQATQAVNLGQVHKEESGAATASAGEMSITPTPAIEDPTKDDSKVDLEILTIDARTMETNAVWWKMAWLLTVENRSGDVAIFNAHIKFLDDDGFVVDEDFTTNLSILPYTSDDYTGAKLVTASVAPNVAKIAVEIGLVGSSPPETPATQPSPTSPVEPTKSVTDAQPTTPVTPTPGSDLLFPTPTPAVGAAIPSTTDQVVNRRAAPDANAEIVGSTTPGEALRIVGQTLTGDWYLLEDGSWIFADLVANPPTDMPVVNGEPGGQGQLASLPTGPVVNGADAAALNSYMVGNAKVPLPAPSDSDFDVVELARTSDLIHMFVRNNTDSPVRSVSVDTVAKGADGTMLAIADTIGMEPRMVKPGEVAYGTIYFSDFSFPPGVVFSHDVSATDISAGDTYGDLTVEEVNLVGNRFIGTLRNNSQKKVSGPVEAMVLCFDQQGTYLSRDSEYTVKNVVEAGASIPFQIELREACPYYLIFASGFSF